MPINQVEVVRLTPANRSDFYAVHCRENSADWCFCAAWWVPTWEGWGDRTAEENRALRESLFEQGVYDGYLLERDGSPAGWCQCGPRDRLEKLCRQFDLAPDPEVWAVTCFLLAPEARGQGLAQHLLESVLEDLLLRGVKKVQGFPKRGEGLSAGEVWTGTEAMFQKAGFTIVRDDPLRPIYEKRLTPA